jgi:PAS domain S-box-containing protein
MVEYTAQARHTVGVLVFYDLVGPGGRTPLGVMMQVTETVQSRENMLAMNEALMLGSLRQHELAEASALLNVQLQREITERKLGEEALFKVGALQRAIFNSANFSSIATDAKGVIQIFNVGAERMLGYAAAEVMNKTTPADISDPEELIARAKALSAELATPITLGFEALVFKASRGIEDIYELTYIRKDGSRFPAVVSVTALRDAQETIIGYLLIGTDNTARKLVESEKIKLDQRLRDQQFYTRSLIESNIDALMTTDPSGIITDVNNQMEALTGCTRDELIGAPFNSHFTDPERAEAAIKLALSEKKVTDFELTACAHDGKQTVVSCNATTFYDRGRTLQGVFVAARDITERKEAEQRQHFLMNELAHRSKNLLAVIASITASSLSGTRSVTEAREVLTHRIQALARSQSALLMGGFEGAPIAEIIRLEFEGFSDQVKSVGPDVLLNPRVAQTFALVVHELATNATKHGALSLPDGQVAIHWSVEGVGAEARFKFQWQERNGPPVVPPTRQGFGHMVIERAAAQGFGLPKISFASEGLSYEIDAPLSAVAAAAPKPEKVIAAIVQQFIASDSTFARHKRGQVKTTA